MSVKLEHFVGTYLPPSLARMARGNGVPPRYWILARACRAGYKRSGHLYPQKVLSIAGLPKSGTTWARKTLASHPGFQELLIPEATTYSPNTGASLDSDLPPGHVRALQRHAGRDQGAGARMAAQLRAAKRCEGAMPGALARSNGRGGKRSLFCEAPALACRVSILRWVGDG